MELDPQELQSSGEAYAKEIRFRRITNDVVFFDPTQPPPPIETRQTVEQDSRVEVNNQGIATTFQWGRVFALLTAMLVLFGVVYLFIVFGGRLPASFARNPEEGNKQGSTTPSGTPAKGRAPLQIDAILRMADRRLALVALCKSLLARLMSAEGVLLQDSWTDRDTLSRVPKNLSNRDALQALVHASERVQFGGRDVSEDEFNEHVARLRPLWTGHAT
ncbi:DUF4129 domain-containing protein [Octadecabacter algicola]|uniref:DUF4129 domain-containing protein n=1 Tax=Octadecabacter algicola TaxID=2909342 RepID=UPI00300C7EDF